MKINDPKNVSPADLAATQAAARRTEARGAERRADDAKAATTPAATVELSGRARELHEARRLADGAPDVRADKVADVKRRIDDGTYEVDATRIARGLLDRRA